MKTKLMIIALTFCSSLALAGAPRAAPEEKTAAKPKLSKLSADKATAIDETVLGTGLGSVGTGGLSTKGSAPAKKMVRGTAPAPTK